MTDSEKKVLFNKIRLTDITCHDARNSFDTYAADSFIALHSHAKETGSKVLSSVTTV